MRTLLAFICSVALAFAANGAQEKKKQEKPAPKKPAQGAQQRGGPKEGGPKGGGQHQQTNASGAGAGKGKAKGEQHGNVPAGNPSGAGAQKTKERKGAQPTTTTGQAPGAGKTKQGQANVAQGKSKRIKPQHFNVPNKPNTAKAPPVKFQQNRRIEGSQNGRAKNMLLSATINPSGTIRIGGTAITTGSYLYLVHRTFGTPVTGTLPGATRLTRITPGTGLSMPPTISRPIR